jgi:Na+(H+)/acetate symporter ActP
MKLLWVFLIYGALASAALIPTILSLYWKRLTSRGAFWGAALSFVIGLPLSIYANFTNSPHLVVIAALASTLIGLVICLIDGYTNTSSTFDYQALLDRASDVPTSVVKNSVAGEQT